MELFLDPCRSCPSTSNGEHTKIAGLGDSPNWGNSVWLIQYCGSVTIYNWTAIGPRAICNSLQQTNFIEKKTMMKLNNICIRKFDDVIKSLVD